MEKAVFLALEKYKNLPDFSEVNGCLDIPENCIWQMWWEGEENAPDVVRICIDSVRSMNPHRKVVVLSESTLKDYVTLPDYIYRKHSAGLMSTARFSEIVRLYLLSQYGGTWIDASVYMSGEMPSAIEDSSFFVYKSEAWIHAGNSSLSLQRLRELVDGRSIPYESFSTWLIHSEKGNAFVRKLLAMMLEYWRDNDAEVKGSLFRYLGTWALLADAECRQIYAASPWVPQMSALVLQQRLNITCERSWIEAVCNASPIHLLSYKRDVQEAICPGSVLSALYRRWHDGAPLHENTDYFKYTELDDAEFTRRWKMITESESRLRKRVSEGKKIRVTYLVAMLSMFPARPLLEEMLKDERYEVNLVVIPELRFGEERARQYQYELSKALEAYGDIVQIAPFNPYEDRIRLFTFTDIVIPPTPYDISTIWYDYASLIRQRLLIAFINYGFPRSSNYCRMVLNFNAYQSFWKILVETEYNMAEYKSYAKRTAGRNTLLTGYCKMDFYKRYESMPRNAEKKNVLIAPHHSVEGGFNDMLSLSNFMRYSDFFLSLPEKYPNLQFIFRPHPALFPVLERDTHWGKEKAETYRQKMCAQTNVIWSEKGDFMEDFAMSVAAIQDCGSFLVDYFYTGKPQCYMLHCEDDIKNKFAPLGQKCLDYCYIAYDEAAITNFLENVVLGGDDWKCEARQKFAREEVMLHYPHASAVAADMIYKSLS